jgi:hypothetical protein
MHDDEVIVWGQMRTDRGGTLLWEDVEIPTVKEGRFPATGAPRNLNLREWGETLTRFGMVGVYRAYTARQRVVELIITEKPTYVVEMRPVIE